MYGQLYHLLISVLLSLSFPLASMAYVMTRKEILLRRGQGALFSFSQVTGYLEREKQSGLLGFPWEPALVQLWL